MGQNAWRSCRCPILGGAEGQVGWGCEQSGLGESVPAHDSGYGNRWSFRSLPTQTIL